MRRPRVLPRQNLEPAGMKFLRAQKRSKRAWRAGAMPSDCRKSLAEFAPAGAKEIEIRFLRRRVRRRKHFSARKCGNCPLYADSSCAQSGRIPLEKVALPLFRHAKGMARRRHALFHLSIIIPEKPEKSPQKSAPRFRPSPPSPWPDLRPGSSLPAGFPAAPG